MVREGNSVTILCISTGAPTPSISWELDGHPAPFQSTEKVTEGQATISLVFDEDRHNRVPYFDIISSTITSDLLIENAQYPDHDGVYTCTGSNDKLMINISSDMINVQVIGKCTRSSCICTHTYHAVCMHRSHAPQLMYLSGSWLFANNHYC